VIKKINLGIKLYRWTLFESKNMENFIDTDQNQQLTLNEEQNHKKKMADTKLISMRRTYFDLSSDIRIHSIVFICSCHS